MGTWIPTTIDPSQGVGTVFAVFTPDVLFCASPLEISFLIEEGENPIFEIDTSFCELDDIYMLPLISNNGISGSWNINPIDPSALGVGTHQIVFTPGNADCYGLLSFEIEVKVPKFPSFDLNDTLCTNNNIYELPTISLNGIEGSWNIPSIDPSTLGAGNINLIFSPDDDCTEIYEATILIENSPILVELDLADPSNCGTNDGTIVIDATGNNLSYSIDGGNIWSDNPNFNNLSGGIYNVVVTNGICDVLVEISLTSPGAPMIDSIIINPLSNCDVIDASLEIVAQGIDLEYSIDGGISYVDTNIFVSLESGIYTIIVRSKTAPDCTAWQVVSIENIEETILLDVSIIDVTDCGLMNGQLIIEATGHLLQYSIDGGISWQLSNTFSDLDVGTYTIIVRSELYDNCKVSTESLISGPMNPVVNEVPRNKSKPLHIY